METAQNRSNQLKEIMSFPIKKLFYHPLKWYLYQIEKKLMKKRSDFKFSPIFIIGPPRCGSTLLYLVLARYFNFCYFSNFLMRFPMSPLIISKITKYINVCNPNDNFKNDFGKTVGWNSPNQGIDFWDRWFPNNYGYIGLGVLDYRAKNEIRNTIAQMQNIFRAPYINKWQVNSARILPMSNIFPEALFIRVKRNPIFTAQSILKGKRELFNNEMRWFSVKSSNYQWIKNKEPIDQICSQIYDIEQDIDRDSKIVGEDRFLEISYEELCDSVPTIMEKISDFYNEKNFGNYLKRRKEVPLTFYKSDSIHIDANEIMNITKSFEQLSKQ